MPIDTSNRRLQKAFKKGKKAAEGVDSDIQSAEG